LSAARNTGTDAATGTYIYYLDSDDEMTIDCLEKLAAPVEQDVSIEMVMGDFCIDTSAMIVKRHRLRRKLGTPQPRFMQDTPLELKSNEEIRNWFYKGKIARPICVWNKLLKLSFVKENQLYNKEGQLYEDTLWTYYLMRCLNHAAFVHEVTYLYYRRPGSICTGTEYDERLRHFGFIFREIAENIVHGERLEETMHWHKGFCRFYIDAHDNLDFQFAYNAFHREISSALHRSQSPRPATHHLSPGQAPVIGSASSPLHLSPGQAPAIGSASQLGSYSTGQLRSALWLLTTVHYLSKSRVGRLLFKTALRLRRLLQRIVQTYHRARPQ
jgi:glycosyltransferase involved in cell wall biosynthesis